MALYWLIITLSCFGPASLQYLTADPNSIPWEALKTSDDILQPGPYIRFIDLPTLTNGLGLYGNTPIDNSNTVNSFEKNMPGEKEDDVHVYLNEPPTTEINHKYYDDTDDSQAKVQKKRQLPEEDSPIMTNWFTNLNDLYIEKTKDTDIMKPDYFTRDYSTNATNNIIKRSFSPWGGKRRSFPLALPGKTGLEYMWTWKRSPTMREPSMPKRVRFSPWGGKRNGHLVYKPGSKSSRITYTSPIMRRFNLGLQFIPDSDRHHYQVVALSAKFDDKSMREELPFKRFLENAPIRYFKPGHTYAEVNLKKDGKRKVKFSTWGGKRSPPIIGPIWTPARSDLKESILNALLMLSQGQEQGKFSKSA